MHVKPSLEVRMPSERPPLQRRAAASWRPPFDGVALGRRQATPGIDRHGGAGTSPDANHLAAYQQGTWPDARRPELWTTPGIGDEKLTVGAPEQEVRVAAWKQADRVTIVGGHVEPGLVLRQDPSLPDRSPHRDQRPGQGIESGLTDRRPDACPLSEGSGSGRTEGVQIATRELGSRGHRLDARRRDRPDRRPTGAIPSDQHSPGRRGVAKGARVDPQRLADLARGHRSAVQERVEPVGDVISLSPA